MRIEGSEDFCSTHGRLLDLPSNDRWIDLAFDTHLFHGASETQYRPD